MPEVGRGALQLGAILLLGVPWAGEGWAQGPGAREAGVQGTAARGTRTAGKEVREAGDPARRVHLRFRAGAERRQGELLFAAAGSPTRLPAWTAPFLEVDGGAPLPGALGKHFRMQVEVTSSGLSESLPHGPLRRLEVVGEGGPLHFRVGRRPLAWGGGAGGGLLFSGAVPLDGGGLGTRAPFRLPGRGAWLGRFEAHLVLARVSDNGGVGAPWIVAQYGRWTPREPVTFTFRKSAMFGGEGAAGVTPRRFWGAFIGRHGYEDGDYVPFDNQLAAVGLELNPGLWQAGLEVGMEDSSGAWARSPAIQGYLQVGDARSLRLERSYFSRPNGHGRWYHHGLYRDGWSDRGIPLGHPMGGGGTEWLVEVRWQRDRGREGTTPAEGTTSAEASAGVPPAGGPPARTPSSPPALSGSSPAHPRLAPVTAGTPPTASSGGTTLALRVFTRERDASNGFAPPREGRRWGASGEMQLPIAPGWDALASMFVEAGKREIEEWGVPGVEPIFRGATELGVRMGVEWRRP